MGIVTWIWAIVGLLGNAVPAASTSSFGDVFVAFLAALASLLTV